MRGSFVKCVGVATVALACAGGEDAASSRSAAEATPSTAGVAAAALDACEVLRAMDLSRFIGSPPHSFNESVHNEAGSRAVSLCLATPDAGVPIISLMLRRDPEGPDPRSRQEYIDQEVGSDIDEMGPEQIALLQGAEEVSGLGDYALAYALIGQQMAVYWKGEYYLMASTTGLRDRALAREAVEAVAREAVARH